ncbi:hypothetical protein ACFYYR_29200 [Streptomyces sp. NPDC001922]|uniref:hypothetical protein n=1 Tax=Streptomyces sp. NPDC001922 TaxID=3364624 RepID=UPI0036781F3E
MTCDEGDGDFHFGSDLDVRVTGDDDLKEVAADSDTGEISCFVSPPNTLRRGTLSASVPVFTARTNLYEGVRDPKVLLDRIFDRSTGLLEGYGRNYVGKPRTVTSRTLLQKCQRNVTDTVPMTTCYWSNYGAAGVVDFYPPNGQHLPTEIPPM